MFAQNHTYCNAGLIAGNSTNMQQTPKIDRPKAHPMAGKTMTGAEMVVQVLADEGVDSLSSVRLGGRIDRQEFRHGRSHDRPCLVLVVATIQQPRRLSLRRTL